MAYLLRALLAFMLVSITLTVMAAKHIYVLPFGHIQLAIPTFIFVIFIQAFIMFYFIGISRLVNNVHAILRGEGSLDELFDVAPADMTPYLKKVDRYVFDSTLCKRQTIPWTMLMLVLGTAGFLLGGAHDTGMVSKVVHAGVIYGFIAAVLIGFVRQWIYLGKSHKLLREMKSLFGIADASM
ncbi:MAG: hypothetical protein ACOYL6_05375 [Bacteriovoracaceae bacterium]